jgi:2-polyprenyl-3-methyl-5-hydroxy-6-metoxy-1,4-benzoquinol methylase
MSNRILKHFRFGPTFARINRTLRTRRKAIKKIMGLYKKFGLVSDGCSLCKSNNFTLISEGDRYGFDLKKQFCNECGLIQTYPAVSRKFHEEFYSFHYRPLYLKSETVDYEDVIKEQTDKAEKYLDYFIDNGLTEKLANLSIIEIGCSSGGTINGLKKAVKSIQGCDLDVEAIKFAQDNFKIDVEVAMFPSLLPDGPKLFILSHILEHVFNPLETLKEIRLMMSPGDYLFVAVPGLNGVSEGDYKHDLRRYFHIAHVTDFTATTLTNVANYAGFRLINIDEEINGLFIADKAINWKKNNQDSIENVQSIEKTYKGTFPHL